MAKNKIMYEGELDLNGLTIPCYVLEDGTRVLSGRGMQDALNMVDEQTDTSQQTSGARLTRYLTQKSLQPFIYQDKKQGHFEPLECFRGEQKIHGYEATVLVDICDAFLEARKKIELSSRQQIIAEQCEILVRSFAKVGITALVDEATGYQYERERDELQKILKAYIVEETLKWQLTFTDEFYREVFRLWKIPFIPKFIKRKPQFVGNVTTKYVYEALPDGVIEKIREITPKTESGNYKYRFHQSLTPEIGREHLKKQIIQTTTLMSISSSKEQFQRLFEQKYGKYLQQAFDFDSEVMIQEEELKLSKHNKALKKALNYNPTEDKFKQVKLF